ncbi:MAG: right-handed parallel beta-helix repeat-containing protein [Pseudomonadota bacterium]
MEIAIRKAVLATIGAILLAPLLDKSAVAVTFTVDRTDHAPGAAGCTAAPVDCSLAGAIAAAGAMPGDDLIVLPADVLELTQNGSGPVIDSAVTIRGTGMADTTIVGGSIYREPAFKVAAGGTLVLEDLTVRGFFSTSDGGAITVTAEALASAELRRVTVTESQSDIAGGGISVLPPIGAAEPAFRLRLFDSVVSLNRTGGKNSELPCAGAGLGIHNGHVLIDNTLIVGNETIGVADGGGLCIGAAAEVSLIDTTVRSNETQLLGAGIYQRGGHLQIEAGEIEDNGQRISFVDAGAGVHSAAGSLSIRGTAFRFNDSSVADGPSALAARDLDSLILSDVSVTNGVNAGVAITVRDVMVAELKNLQLLGPRSRLRLFNVGEVQIEQLLIERRASERRGMEIRECPSVDISGLEVDGRDSGPVDGGVIITQSSVRITDCLLHHNRSVRGAGIGIGEGGAIKVNGSELFLTGCALYENQAEGGDGGAIWSADSDLIVNQSSLYRNRSDLAGGGISIRDGSTLSLLNTTLSRNHSPGATAMRVANFSEAELEHVTITGPVTDTSAESEPLISLTVSSMAFKNSALDGTCELLMSGGDPSSQGGNVLTDETCRLFNSGDQLVDELGIAPLADNGPTPALLSHLPRLDSPLTDTAMNCPPVDQRDRPRGEPCASGAVERLPEDDSLFANGFEPQ